MHVVKATRGSVGMYDRLDERSASMRGKGHPLYRYPDYKLRVVRYTEPFVACATARSGSELLVMSQGRHGWTRASRVRLSIFRCLRGLDAKEQHSPW